MEDLVLLGSFAAIVAFGYYIVSKLDLFMGKTLGEDEMRKERPCFHVVTSSLDAVPSVSTALRDISDRHPDVQCSVSVGQEQEVIESFDAGNADVAIVSADAKSRALAQWKCVALSPKPFLVDDGMVAVKFYDNTPQYQKVLWKKDNPRALTLEFVQQLCRQRL